MLFKLCGCFGEDEAQRKPYRVVVKPGNSTMQTQVVAGAPRNYPVAHCNQPTHAPAHVPAHVAEFLNQHADVQSTPKDDNNEDLEADEWALPAHHQHRRKPSTEAPSSTDTNTQPSLSTPPRLERRATLTFTSSRHTLEFAAAATRLSSTGSPILQLDDLPN